jgi:hypothetical protein
MMKGKVDVISEFPTSQKMLIFLLSFFPKNMMFLQTRQMQEVK